VGSGKRCWIQRLRRPHTCLLSSRQASLPSTAIQSPRRLLIAALPPLAWQPCPARSGQTSSPDGKSNLHLGSSLIDCKAARVTAPLGLLPPFKAMRMGHGRLCAARWCSEVVRSCSAATRSVPPLSYMKSRCHENLAGLVSLKRPASAWYRTKVQI
jgi:hypothetical protein